MKSPYSLKIDYASQLCNQLFLSYLLSNFVNCEVFNVHVKGILLLQCKLNVILKVHSYDSREKPKV
jgi:hypothetical protein